MKYPGYVWILAIVTKVESIQGMVGYLKTWILQNGIWKNSELKYLCMDTLYLYCNKIMDTLNKF